MTEEPNIEGQCSGCSEPQHLCSCPHQPAGLEWQGRLAGEESHLYVDGAHIAIVFKDGHRRWWAQCVPGLDGDVVLQRVSGRVSGQTFTELTLGLCTVATRQACPECGKLPTIEPHYRGAVLACCGVRVEWSTAEMCERWWRKKVSGRFIPR